MFKKLNLLTGYKNNGLFQTTAFKIYNCPYYVFFIRNVDKWDIIFKSKDKKDRIWKYIPNGKYGIVYEVDFNGKAFITIKFDENYTQIVKRDKLYKLKHLSTEKGLVIGGNWNIVFSRTKKADGYLNIRDNDTGKYYSPHRLVAHAFCPRPEHLKDVPYDKLQVNHKDGVKTNNHYTNLEWCTPSENNIHARDTGLSASGDKVYNSALTNEQVKEIRTDYIANLRPYKYYQEKYDVGFDVVQALLNNKTYYDPEYTVPEFVGKKKMTFQDATWVRKHKQENIKTTLFWYAEKFGVDFSTIGKILQNKLHPDPNFDVKTVEKQKPTQDQVNEIIEHKKNNPSTPLSFYEKKYSTINKNTIYKIIKDNIK